MVYISKLNKNIIPYYSPPFSDELLSSWIYRMSVVSNIKPIRFCRNYFEDIKGFWNRDIDLLAPTQILKKLTDITPLTFNEIKNLTLLKYDGMVYEKLNINSYTQNISALGIVHRKRKKFGLLYCPKCLKKEGGYRTKWRLETSIVCVDCKHYLYDRCIYCQAPVSFHRINFNSKKNFEFKITICSNCHKDLSTFQDSYQPTKEEINYQIFIDNTIRSGYNIKDNYSFSYLRVLLRICSKLNTSNSSNQFKINFKKKYSLKQTDTNNYFRFLPIEQKRDLLVKTNHFLINWPSSLFELRLQKRFNNSYITENIENWPYWFTYYLKFNS